MNKIGVVGNGYVGGAIAHGFSPTSTGNCEVNDKKMQVAAWINTSKDGKYKYMSLKFSEFKPKKDASNTNATPKPEFDDIPF